MSVPCSEDQEAMVLSSNSIDNNTEAFEFNLPTSMPHARPQAPIVAMCTSMIPSDDEGFEVLSSPIQATEHSSQPAESLIQPLLLPNTCVPSAETPTEGVTPLAARSSIPTAPPPPPIRCSESRQKMCVTESYSEVIEQEELEIKADSSSDEQSLTEEMQLY